MSEPKHTPGPWVVERNVMAQGVCHLAVVARHAGQDWMPCSITPMDSMRPIDEANAQLISAAPDLLAALEGILRITDRRHFVWDAAHAAIDKATKETK